MATARQAVYAPKSCLQCSTTTTCSITTDDLQPITRTQAHQDATVRIATEAVILRTIVGHEGVEKKVNILDNNNGEGEGGMKW